MCLYFSTLLFTNQILMSHQPESHKRDLILNYLLPAFNVNIDDHQKTEDIINRCRLKDMVKRQRIESPGLPQEGCLFFSLSAIAHSYQFHYGTRRIHGTMIWKRRSLIFSHLSLLGNEQRTDFVELLENSEVLYLTYPDLNYLMDKYQEIKDTIYSETLKHSLCSHRRYQMLALPAVDRVRWLRETHPEFIAVANQETQSFHVHMSVRSYIDQLNKLK